MSESVCLWDLMVSCVQKFLCLMCRGDEREVNTHAYRTFILHAQTGEHPSQVSLHLDR